MKIDHTMPKDIVRFCDKDGRVLFEIFNLKIPEWAEA